MKVASTRNGVVKYNAAQIQNATCRWLNLSQWMIVATPRHEANRVTGTKPALTVCHCLAMKTLTKK